MTTNKISEDEDRAISEVKKNRSEMAWNWFNIFNSGILLIIAVSNVFININLNKANQKIEDAKFLETTINHLSGDMARREVALSILYSVYYLQQENKEQYKPMLIDISETILESNILTVTQKNSSQGDFSSAEMSSSKKALIILDKLASSKITDEWRAKLRDLRKHTDPKANNESVIQSAKLTLQQKNNASVSALLNTSKQAEGKQGLVFIQYNDESKKDKIEQFRTQKLQKWNAPGEEFIQDYESASDKFGDIRYFHDNERSLSEELQTTLNEQFCPQQKGGCFEIKNLSKNYSGLPKKQFEIWIDAKKI